MAKVIKFPTSAPSSSLVLREVVCGATGELTKWFKSIPGARAKFRVRIRNLRSFPRTDWNKKQFHKLDHGLAEIKWKLPKLQFAAVGFDYQGAFVMLVGCNHKMNVYDPPSALATARRLKGEVENGKWKTVPFEP